MAGRRVPPNLAEWAAAVTKSPYTSRIAFTARSKKSASENALSSAKTQGQRCCCVSTCLAMMPSRDVTWTAAVLSGCLEAHQQADGGRAIAEQRNREQERRTWT